MSKAYEEYAKKLEEGVYARNRTARTKNRNTLRKTRARLQKKLNDGESKQVKSNASKVSALDLLLSQMNSIESSTATAPAPAPTVSAKAPSPKKASPKATVAAVAAKKPSPKAALAVLAVLPALPALALPAPPTKVHPPVVKALVADFFKTLPTLNKGQLEEAVKYLSDLYYNEGVSLISDEDYDRLAETLKTKFGKTFEVGAEVTKNKVKLPYFMGSMDKIKPEKNNLASWKLRYPGPVCISDKLDGISALYVKEGGKKALYTRGDGTIGQDITHMLDHIQIGDIPPAEHCVVRGELIVSKENYDRVKEGKRGARQMVSGLSNQKTLTAERVALMNLVEFVAYEVIVPEALSPSLQFTLLDARSTFHTAAWSSSEAVTLESLSELLTARKAASKYEIDGIIVAHDDVYPRVAGKNPEHAFAFKMSFADQQTTTEVLDVRWEASKDGFLKPTVQFEPVNIGGVIIQYATGFNAAFIHEQGVGPGAFVEIIRSGDVIPYIKKVHSPAPAGPAMPAAKWHWNETHVDAVLDDIAGDEGVQKRVLLYFANTLDIAFCGEGNINKLFAAGIRTIPQLIHVKESQIASQFAAKSAAKLVESVQEAIKKATLVTWAVGSGLFGRGIGTKRLGPAFAIVEAHKGTRGAELTALIAALDGWSATTAAGFVEHLPAFEDFLETVGITPKVKSPPLAAAPKPATGTGAAAVAAAAVAGPGAVGPAATGLLKDLVVLFTGFHPKDLEAAVPAQGGTVADSFTKKVTVLVIKDASVSNEKTKKAGTAGIPVMTDAEFRAKYRL